MQQEVKAILLPQEDVKDYTRNNILKSKYQIRISDSKLPEDDEYEEPQHLYIVDEKAPIKEGDICIYEGVVFQMDDAKWCKGQKVVATTDFKWHNKNLVSPVPSISEEFLKQFVDAQGKGKIMMEMEDATEFTLSGFKNVGGLKPKTTFMNVAVLSIVSEQKEVNGWSVAELAKQAVSFLEDEFEKIDNKPKVDPVEEAAKEWMKENGSYADTLKGFKAGWKANPAKWTDEEVLELMEMTRHSIQHQIPWVGKKMLEEYKQSKQK